MAPYRTRPANIDDLQGIERLLPRLADFPAPERLSAEDVWRYDAKVVAEWAQGQRPDTWIRVAVDPHDTNETVVGVAIGTMMTDSFTDQKSVHLEVVVIDESADGHGLGRTLMSEIEAEGVAKGAAVMSLNVMVENERARAVYQGLGFAEEMIRASRPI